MRPDAAFTSITAARLWGAPMPQWIPDDVVHVAVRHGTARPGGRGVVGVQYAPRSYEIVELDGLRVLSPASTWTSLAPTLGLADLVAVGDFLVTPGFASVHPALASVEDLAAAAGRPRLRGRDVALAASRLVRVGSLSRPESLTRVLAVTGGLPEPVCNLRVSPLLMFDVAWPTWRVGLDYHGASHRSASQYARDVGRSDLARHEGWDAIQITASDLFDSPFDTLGRIRGRLSRRGAPVRTVPAHHVALARR